MLYPPQTLKILHKTQVSDGIGGLIEDWKEFKTVKGYIDLLTGTDLNTAQNAYTEQSTHIAVIPQYTEGITNKMRVEAENGNWYEITQADNPVGINHHLELYLNFGGESLGNEVSR